MILVTVGAQMPFDRLVKAVDAWAGRTPSVPVFAQIGPTDFEPRHMRWTKLLDPDEFRRLVGESQAIVGHAGMGTILTAMEHGKPLIVMPRRGDLRETRNDHQVATAERFRETGKIVVALDVAELDRRLDDVSSLRPGVPVSPYAGPELIRALRQFIGLRDAAAGPAVTAGTRGGG